MNKIDSEVIEIEEERIYNNLLEHRDLVKPMTKLMTKLITNL